MKFRRINKHHLPRRYRFSDFEIKIFEKAAKKYISESNFVRIAIAEKAERDKLITIKPPF